MRLALSSVSCPQRTLQGIAEDARNYGFDGVELRTAADNRHLSIHTPQNFAATIARLFRRDSRPIFSLKCSTRLSAKNCQAEGRIHVERLIELAAQMQASFVRVTLDERAMLDGRVDSALMDAFNHLATAAAARNVRLAVETEGPWTSGRLLKSFLDGIEARQAVGVVYNLFNCFTARNDAWEESYELLKRHICYCRVVDGFTGQDGQAEHCLLGAGELPIRRIVERLLTDGYDGFYTFDWQLMHNPRLDPPEHALPHFVRTMRAIQSSLGRTAARRQDLEPVGAAAQ